MPRRFLSLVLILFPALLSAQGRGGRGGFNPADSIKYKYASTPKLDALKDEVAKEIDNQAKSIQVMVDKVFSFAEPFGDARALQHRGREHTDGRLQGLRDGVALGEPEQ